MHLRKTVLSKVNLLLVALICLALTSPAPAKAQDSTGRIFVPFVISQGAAAEQTAPPQQTVAITANPATAAAVQAYWTAERRAAARPYVPAAGPTLPPGAAGASASTGGIPGTSPAGRPAPGSDLAAKAAFPEAWTADAALEAAEEEAASDAGLEAAAVDGTAGVYTTYAGNNNSQFWKNYPYKATGKLYFTTWDGYGSYCSASIISPNNVLVTAAHCVYDTDFNQWQDRWLFVPAERNYAQPYGAFDWAGARVLNNWISAANYNAGIRYDVAVITLAPNSVGRPVTYYTGWLGRSWNYGYVQNQTEIGYAGNISQAYSRISHSESYNYATDILGYGSNMGGGASGSPILRRYAPYQTGNLNFVNAVQSGSNNRDNPTRNVAPRFSSDNIVPLCNDEGC